MQTSEQLNELAAALSKAQAKIEGASKDALNPHFGKKYADLASVWDACRKPLTENGLSVIQTLAREGALVKCTTMLLHSSGQFVKSEFAMTPQQNTPQAAGSCATYLRRYSLQSIVGVAPDDDDGNEACAGKSQAPTRGGANDRTTPKAPTMAAASANVSTTRQAANVSNVAIDSAPKFDPENPIHRDHAIAYLASKKAPRDATKVFLEMMSGRPALPSSLNEVWKLMNINGPDLPPGEL